MKNFNLIKRLWTDSHEKQSPQRFIRYAAMLTMLFTLGVGQMWADSSVKGASIKYDVNGSSNQWWNVSATAKQLGQVYKFDLKGFWTQIGTDNVCQNTCMYYGFTSDCSLGNYNITNPNDWSQSTKHFQTESMSVNILSGLTPNKYTLYAKFIGHGQKSGNSCGEISSSTYQMNFEYPAYLTGDGTWCGTEWNTTADAQKMTYNDGGYYSKTVSSVTQADHQLKVATYNWVSSWGHAKYDATNSSNVYSESDASGNLQFQPAMAGDVTIKFNISDQKISIICTAPTITLDDEGGSGGSGTQNTYYNVATSNVSVPTRTGYTFGGYYDGDDGTGNQIINASGVWQKNKSNFTDNSSTAKWIVRADYTLHAKWTAKTPTINFDQQSGTGGSSSVTATYDAEMPSATMPTRSGYTFDGYFTAVGGGGTKYYNANGSSAKTCDLTSTTTLYAKWTQTITLDEQGATTSGTTSKSVTYNSNDGMSTMITAPSKTGYDYGGYYTDVAGSGYQIINNQTWQASVSGYTDASKNWIHSGATTIYAKWTQTVTLNANTDNHGSGANKSATATWNGTALSGFTATAAATGYNLIGYYSAATSGTKVLNADGTYAASNVTDYISSSKWQKAGATTLYAHMQAKTYSVTLDKNGGNSDGSVTATYNSSSLTSFSGAAYAGYSCDGYFTAADGGTKIINSNGTLVDGTVSDWLSSGYWVNDGADITLYAHWTEDATYYTLHYTYGTGLSSRFSSISAAKTSGGDAVADNASLVSGTGVTVTATPADHYRFVGWYSASGCAANTLVSTDNPYSFTMDDNISLYAKAEQMTTVITLNANGGSGGSSSVTATHGSSTIPSFTAPTRTGYALQGWYTTAGGGSRVLFKGGTTAGSVSGYTDGSGNWIYTESTLTLYAHWTANTYKVTFDQQSGSGGSANVTATYNAAMPSATMPTRTGYDFNGYFGSAGGSGTKYYNADGSSAHVWDVASATSIYAYWTAHNYSITYSPSSAPTGCTYTTKPTSADYNTTVDMVITPSTGYTVSVSAVDESSNVVTVTPGASNHYTFTQPASAVTVSVSASEITHDITIVNGVVYGGSATSTTAGIATTAKITANAPAAGKKFTGWTLGSGASLAGGYALTDRTIEVNATADATVTANYADRAGVKMYFAKPTTLSWSKVYAYAWKSSDASIKNATYPGIELEDTEVINCVTYYIYQYYTEGDGIGGAATGNSAWNKIVFGDNDNDRKTGDLNIADGHYYYRATTEDTSGKESAITSAWYIKGSMNSWGETDPIDHNCVSNSGSVEMTLTAGNTYEFKVYNEVNNQMWSNSTAMGGENPIQGSMVAAQTLYTNDENVMKVKTAKTGTYIFRITSTNTSTPALQVGFPDLALAGEFNDWNTTANEFVDGVVTVENLAANTDYEFKVVQGGAWFGCTGTITTSEANWVFYNPGDNCVLTTKEAGTYVFGWNTETHVLTVIYPNDQPKMKLTSEQYLYFDASKLTTTGDGWNKSDFTARFWLKHYATGADITGLDCTKATATALEENIYYVKLPANNNIGQVQIDRLNPENLSDITCTANKTTAFARSNASQNCLKEETGKENYCNAWTPQWTTYCPPIRTSTLSDNSTTKITWQSSGGAGTSENPYLVSTSHSIEVQGAATQVVNDVNMTINYDFKVGGSSQQASASNTYSHTSLSNNTTYTITMDSYNAYNGETGTKNTSATALYYKALDTYTVTNDLTNISSDGRSGAHAAAYNIAYTATLSVSAGYSLPTTITVKRGSTNITASCTYDSSTGALTIPAAQMTGGDITITAAGVAQPLTFTGATTSWSTTSNWSPACVPTIEHDVTINKPAVVDIEHAAAKSIVLDQSGEKTGKLTIQANKGLEVEGTIRVKNKAGNTVVTTPKDLVLQSSSAGNASLIFDNEELNDRKDSATVQMYSKAEIPGSGHWKWQYIGLPFTSANATYTYYGSYIWKLIGGMWETVANGATLEPWQGYSITNSSATTYEMEGELVSTEDKVFAFGNEDGQLLANSWTAPIYIDAFETEGVGATFTATPAEIYLFNTGSTSDAGGISSGSEPGTYISVPVKSATYIGCPYIAPMQGFWISTKAGTGAGNVTLKYDELVRPASERAIVAGAMRAPKREQTEHPQVMKIFATGAKYSDRVTILSREDFSRGFDNGWDGEKISFGQEAPSIFVINGQDSYDEVSSIPEYEGTVIGFRSGTNNMATISFDYDGEETLYLNDLRDQTSALISNENTYEFSTSANDDEARFIISATPIMFTPTAVENNTTTNENKVQKIIFNDRVYIIRNGRMYDATGVLCK